ncbi:MAG: DUF4288 domain-containing protein [Flavobacteriales bacterium]
MEFYIARLVFQIQHEAKPNHFQFEECFCWVNGSDYQEALDKAEQIGRLKQLRLTDIRGFVIDWVFVGIAQLELTPFPDHGSELFSHIRIQENATEYVQYIRAMHENLRSEHIKEELTL